MASFPLSLPNTDTLLNVFIAIAVDNLAQAQAMTAAELAAARQMRTQLKVGWLSKLLPPP